MQFEDDDGQVQLMTLYKLIRKLESAGNSKIGLSYHKWSRPDAVGGRDSLKIEQTALHAFKLKQTERGTETHRTIWGNPLPKSPTRAQPNSRHVSRVSRTLYKGKAGGYVVLCGSEILNARHWFQSAHVHGRGQLLAGSLQVALGVCRQKSQADEAVHYLGALLALQASRQFDEVCKHNTLNICTPELHGMVCQDKTVNLKKGKPVEVSS